MIRVVVWVILIIGVNFMVWRKLHLEYDETEVLKFGVWILGVGLGGVLLVPWVGWWATWAGVVMIMLGFCRGRMINFWELGDYLWLTTLGSIGVASLSIERVDYAIGAGVGIVVLGIISRIYRNFFWYRSGKPGFIVLATWMWWGGVETVVAMAAATKIYWAGLAVTQWIAVCVIEISAIILYLRSGLRVGENIWRKIQNLISRKLKQPTPNNR